MALPHNFSLSSINPNTSYFFDFLLQSLIVNNTSLPKPDAPIITREFFFNIHKNQNSHKSI